MLIMAIEKNGKETENDIKKYAKKCGYAITGKIYILFHGEKQSRSAEKEHFKRRNTDIKRKRKFNKRNLQSLGRVTFNRLQLFR